MLNSKPARFRKPGANITEVEESEIKGIFLTFFLLQARLEFPTYPYLYDSLRTNFH